MRPAPDILVVRIVVYKFVGLVSLLSEPSLEGELINAVVLWAGLLRIPVFEK